MPCSRWAGLLLLLFAPARVGAQLLRSPALAVGGSLGANQLGLEMEWRPTRVVAFVGRADGFPIADYPTAHLGIRIDPIGDRFARVFLMPILGVVHCPLASVSGIPACPAARWHSAVGGVVGAEIALSEAGRYSLGLQGGYLRVRSEPASRRLSRMLIDAVFRVRFPLGRRAQ